MSQEGVDVFRGNDEEFERDLARTAGRGFFLGRPIQIWELRGDAMAVQETPEQQRMDELHRESAIRIKQMLVEEMQQDGMTEKQINEHEANATKINVAAEERRAGYAGWLVTDPGFRRARDVMHGKWNKQIEKLRRFPCVPMSLMGVSGDRFLTDDHEFDADFQHFYSHWGLERMATWELPVPLRPELVTPSFYHLPDVGHAGLLVFMPWYLFRDRDISLRDLIDHRLQSLPPKHLAEWIMHEEENWGHKRYGVIFCLYVYLELALNRRYGPRVTGNVDNLDRAFAAFLRDNASSGTDTIKKIRLQMADRLKNPPTSS